MPLYGPPNLVQTKFVEITSDTSTTSTTFVDLLSTTLTTQGGALLIHFDVSCSNSNTGKEIDFQVLLDGTVKKAGGVRYNGTPAGDLSLSYKTAILTAGSHTVKVQWKTESNTANIRPVTAPTGESASMTILEALT